MPSTPAAPPPLVVTVDGVRVPLGPGSTVTDALVVAHRSVRDGRLLSARTHRVLDPHREAGTIFRGPVPATLSTPVSEGDVLSLVPGRDAVEPVRTMVVVLPADPTGAGLYVGGRPGSARVVRGTVSAETVRRTVLVAPVIGRLRVPGSLVLTFDDGPGPATPEVLALLARHGVNAVFCEVGTAVERRPALTRAVLAGGNVLCDHTWSHDLALRTRSPAVIMREIARGKAAITAAAGVTPVFFRVPGGNWSPTIEAEARRQMMLPLRWSVDPRDWSRPGADAIVERVLSDVRPGGVVLMHDGGGDRSQTVAALAVLLDRLPRMGYRIVLP